MDVGIPAADSSNCRVHLIQKVDVKDGKVHSHLLIRFGFICFAVEKKILDAVSKELLVPLFSLHYFIFVIIRNYEFENCSLITSLFTLQFMPYSCREEVINNIYDGLNEGGAFIFGEKIDTSHSRIENMLRTVYYEFKSKSFDYEDIMQKEQT